MNKKLKKIIFVLFLFTAMVITSQPLDAQEETINIICTNSALADFTSNILTENISIDYIMPAGACPSHFDTSPSDILKIMNADVIISLGWEPWLEALINKSGNQNYAQIKCSNLGEWNIPTGASSYVEAIRDGLIGIYPDLEQTINTNTQTYLSLINTTAEELKDKILSEGYAGREIVSMEWQMYFLDWLGLNITAYYSPPESLSVQDELNIITAASEPSVCAIVDNLQSGTSFGARVAGETGISHVIFTNFPGAIPDTDTYLKMIKYNTNQLIQGIATHDQTSTSEQELLSQIGSLELQRNLFAAITVIALLGVIILFIMYKRK